jgi:hypothetical protein
LFETLPPGVIKFNENWEVHEKNISLDKSIPMERRDPCRIRVVLLEKIDCSNRITKEQAVPLRVRPTDHVRKADLIYLCPGEIKEICSLRGLCIEPFVEKRCRKELEIFIDTGREKVFVQKHGCQSSQNSDITTSTIADTKDCLEQHESQQFDSERTTTTSTTLWPEVLGNIKSSPNLVSGVPEIDLKVPVDKSPIFRRREQIEDDPRPNTEM